LADAIVGVASYPIDQRESVQPRHPEVRHQDIGRFGIQHADRVRAGRGGSDARPGGLQHLADERQRIWLVVDGEDVEAG
jgi:hypothetical protein